MSKLMAEQEDVPLKGVGPPSDTQHAGRDEQYFLFDEAEAYADEHAPPVSRTNVAEEKREKLDCESKDCTLPVIECTHEIEVAERPCQYCGKIRPVVGAERSSEYDLSPAHFVKIMHIRNMYQPCNCKGFDETKPPQLLIAPAPAKIMPKSDFSNRTTAFFLTTKYADAIPFSHMTKNLAKHGFQVTRAHLSNEAIAAGQIIVPLINLMNRDMLRSQVLLMNETTVRVLNEIESNYTAKSFMRVQRGFYEGKPIQQFSYQNSRAPSLSQNILSGFEGFYLQADGFNDRFHDIKHPENRSNLIHVGCFAQIRQSFAEAWEASGNNSVAQDAIKYIANLYEVERDLRKQFQEKSINETTFLSRRKRKAEPHLSDFRMWLSRNSLISDPQSKLGRAISYALIEFPRASHYIDHALLTPDTEAVNNAIRPFEIGVKKWCFSENNRGACESSAIYSLIETAKENGHDPFLYLSFIFERLPLCKTDDDVAKLLPYRISPEEVVKML